MHKFSVMFIVVLGGDLVRSTEHLGISYLAAALRQSGYVAIIREYKTDMPMDAIINELCEKQIDMVGFSVTCINLEGVFRLTDRIKAIRPDITVVYGAHMATFDENRMFNNQNVAIVVRGEGEYTILELADKLEKGGSLDDVRGISHRDGNGNIYRNADRPLIEDLDKLPFPVRDQFEASGRSTQYLRVCGSRGCYGTCAYCSNFVGRNHSQKRWRGRSPKKIIDEIEFLVERYNFHTFDFVDSTIEDPPGPAGKERLAEIANEIIKRGLRIHYNCCFRAENWSEEDHPLLDLLVESGLEKINVGIEAGNNKNLALFSKIARVEDNDRMLRVVGKHPEIYITFGFIFYHPYANFDDMSDNANYLYSTGIGQVTRHYLWPLEIYPQTKIRDMLLRDGLMKDDMLVNDIYSYDFVDKNLGTFAKHMVKFLDRRIVWDYEIFDIVVHTYIYRLFRAYPGDLFLHGAVGSFRDLVTRSRRKIAQMNHEFFMMWLNAAKAGWPEELITLASQYSIFEVVESEKKNIQNEQLKLSRLLHKKGYSIPLR